MGTGHQSRTETITVRKRGLWEQVRELGKRQVGHMGLKGRKGITGVRYRGVRVQFHKETEQGQEDQQKQNMDKNSIIKPIASYAN